MTLRTLLGILAGYLVIALLAFAPLLCVLVAGAIAHACGAKVDEGGPHPCIVAGVDIGPLLCNMLITGWLSLITLPLGALGASAYTRFVFKKLFMDG